VHVAEITSPDEALSALSRNVAGGEALGVAEQLPVLSALAAKVRAERDRARAMAQEIEHLHHALETRDIIGQAKGILMERFNVDAVAAFQLLVRVSQESNTRLAVIAQKLVDIDHPSV
jgi:AmiR/NasT family two-component response regulator